MELNLKQTIKKSISSIKEKEKYTYDDYITEIVSILEERRLQWYDELKPVLDSLKGDIERILDIQAEMLSYRQMLIEESSLIGNILSNNNSSLKKKKRDKFVYYSTGFLPEGAVVNQNTLARDQIIINLKSTKGEKDLIISGDLSDDENVIEIFFNYQNFLKDCIKTIDHGLYGVKNKIELWKIKLGIE